jgi:hypothetical protein
MRKKPGQLANLKIRSQKSSKKKGRRLVMKEEEKRRVMRTLK